MRSLHLPVVFLFLLSLVPTLGQAGQIDPGFNVGRGPNGAVRSIVPLGDGSILVGGDFSLWNGEPSGSVVRLNNDGGRDSSFHSEINANIEQLFVQRGGVLAVNENEIFRLLANGARDTNFHSPIISGPAAATEDYLYTTFVPARARPFLEVRAPDGTLLNTVYSGTVPDKAYRLVPFTANRVFMLGHFSSGQMLLFGPDGKDGSFVAPPAREAWNAAVAPGGSFVYAALKFDNATSAFSLRRFDASGQADTGFADVEGTAGDFTNMAVQNDGRLLYGTHTITRLNLDGSVDASFNPDFANTTLNAIAVEPDGKILAGGLIGGVDGTAQPNIVRLLAEGAVTFPQTNAPPVPPGTNVPPAPGEGIVISGRVTDGTNGVAEVKIKAGRRNVTFTDENGFYSLTVSKTGHYVVHPFLKHTRFKPALQRVRVTGDIVLQDFEVRRRRALP